MGIIPTFERIQKYQEAHDYKIMPRLPIVIISQIRNFGKISKNLPKPYCESLSEIIQNTLYHSIMEIEPASFGYTFAGEISIILNNDDSNTWLNNNVQDINSTVTSLISTNFIKNYFAHDNSPDILGSVVFVTNVFPCPSITEMFNYLIWRQSACLQQSLSLAIDSVAGPGYKEGLESKRIDEKKEILLNKYNISFDEYYPSSFRHGTATYKTLKNQKRKWIIDRNLPVFWEDKEFLDINISLNQ
jgi:tRNA(His) 5'-end guanylyltransferase